MTETIQSRSLKPNRLGVKQHKNYFSKVEWKIQRYVDVIADLKDNQQALGGGNVKGLMYAPPLPANQEELQQRITTALQTVTQDMLQRIWEELKYRIDVCRVSGGAHIEHLWNRILNPHISEFSIQIWRNNSYIVKQ